jgi:type II secretory pathway pseudopilin PulG
MEDQQTPITVRPRSGAPANLVWLAVVVVVVGAIVAVGVFWANAQRWEQQASANQVAATQAQHQLAAETKRVAALQGQVSQLQSQNKTLQGQAANPTLSIWNSCSGPCDLGPDKVRVGGVPDTFVLHVTFTATVPISLYFLTLQQWEQYDRCGFDVGCVQGTYYGYSPSSSETINFDGARGCADYVYVLAATQEGTMQPNVTATYNPASQATGVCAQSP